MQNREEEGGAGTDILTVRGRQRRKDTQSSGFCGTEMILRLGVPRDRAQGRGDALRTGSPGGRAEVDTRGHSRALPAPSLTQAADLAAQVEATALLRYGAQHVVQRALLRFGAVRGLSRSGRLRGRPSPEPRGRGRRGTGPARRPRGGPTWLFITPGSNTNF